MALNRIVEKIVNKELKATHFVRGVILGAEVKDDILVIKKDKSDISDIGGEILGTIVCGLINAKVRAALGYFDKEINVNSVPTMKVEFFRIQNSKFTDEIEVMFPIDEEMMSEVLDPITEDLSTIDEKTIFDMEFDSEMSHCLVRPKNTNLNIDDLF